VGPRACLEAVTKRNNPSSCRVSTPDHPARSPALYYSTVRGLAGSAPLLPNGTIGQDPGSFLTISGPHTYNLNIYVLLSSKYQLSKMLNSLVTEHKIKSSLVPKPTTGHDPEPIPSISDHLNIITPCHEPQIRELEK
jgi:hypothetical protein